MHADRKVADLSVGEAQRVEILKTLYRGAKILILDEPTAVLSPPEIHELWSVLRQMRARGETIVLITHKLDEVMEISDTITVMRHGKTVDRLVTSSTTPPEIARAMVGRDVQLAMDYVADEMPRDTDARAHSRSAGRCFDVRDLVVRGRAAAHSRERREPVTSRPARSSASPASRATGRRSWSRRSPVCAHRASGTILIGTAATRPRCR